jgi:hypothetical protein
MLEDKSAQHHQIPGDKYVDPVVSYQMKTYDYIVRPSASAAITITLPPVAEAKGRFYSILARAATQAFTVTIAHKSDSEGWSNIVLRNEGQSVLLYSDGLKWFNLTNGETVTIKTVLTAAQVKAVRATPISLVPAPGTGYINEFISAMLVLDYGTNVFTETADNLTIKYTNGSGVAVSDTIECTGFIDASADTVTRAVPVKDAIVTLAASANQALVLHNTGDGEIAGNAANDSVLTVYTTFRIINNN